MCNFLRKMDPSFKEIPKKGVGWKLFLVKEIIPQGEMFSKKFLRQFNRGSDVAEYITDPNGWVTWRQRSDKMAIKMMNRFCWPIARWMGDGFCLFLDKNSGDKATQYWNNALLKTQFVLTKIEYDEGIGERDEHEFLPDRIFRVALAKKFRLFSDEFFL